MGTDPERHYIRTQLTNVCKGHLGSFGGGGGGGRVV